MRNEMKVLRAECYALNLKAEYQWTVLHEQFDTTVNSMRPSLLIKSALLKTLESPLAPNDILESLIASVARFLAHKAMAALRKE